MEADEEEELKKKEKGEKKKKKRGKRRAEALKEEILEKMVIQWCEMVLIPDRLKMLLV